ncbi:XRE family transcriptional regulator [Lactococcus lactis subsp. lactis]|jgi:transcriptional regulator with XRE-family HTH domain|uniref:XRE family transcriptional regulator n=1 Tax=Lactococcus lactis subsp. lactis TaxID=1360 RepID=A0A2Z3KEB5_LACLL|nr:MULTISPECIES: helix-turn-helix domain-containing protein [Lactococcus]AWN66032.1 XRE family transcriptional regulator [Lactococcus lactis subsp. lactis]MBK0030241.1 helix-turn-helix domain-containing protein [Lactococcus sp. S47]QNL91777.1 helix-turn-helix domain-containing protein [Lactococcus lactis]
MGRAKLTPREESLKPIIATNIKKYLDEFNKKPADLQRGTGIAQSTISDYTSGKTLVNPGNVEKIASFFGILKSDIDPRFSDEWVNENEFPIIEKTISAMKQLEEPRQKIVLDTASSQLEEQKKEQTKVVSIKAEQQKRGIDLADLVDDSKVDWDKWVSFDGKPLTDEVKEAMKKALGKQLEDK